MSARCGCRFSADIDGRARGAEPDPRGNVLDAAPPRPFLRAADEQGRNAQTRAARAARPHPAGHRTCAR